VHGQVMVCGALHRFRSLWHIARRASQIYQLFPVSTEDGKDVALSYTNRW